jgi:hypothetical protein
MVEIEVTGVGPQYQVDLREGKTHTRHLVTVPQETLLRLADGASARDLLKAIFRFLLERETKESILARFEVADVPRYFPEFEREIGRYL